MLVRTDPVSGTLLTGEAQQEQGNDKGKGSGKHVIGGSTTNRGFNSAKRKLKGKIIVSLNFCRADTWKSDYKLGSLRAKTSLNEMKL